MTTGEIASMAHLLCSSSLVPEAAVLLRARVPASEQEWREIQAVLAELEEPS